VESKKQKSKIKNQFSKIKFQKSNFKNQFSKINFQISIFKFQFSKINFQISIFKKWDSKSGTKMEEPEWGQPLPQPEAEEALWPAVVLTHDIEELWAWGRELERPPLKSEVMPLLKQCVARTRRGEYRIRTEGRVITVKLTELKNWVQLIRYLDDEIREEAFGEFLKHEKKKLVLVRSV
jgi:hypothetical protein